MDIVFDTDAPNLFMTAMMKQDLEELLGCPVDVLQLRGLTNPPAEGAHRDGGGVCMTRVQPYAIRQKMESRLSAVARLAFAAPLMHSDVLMADCMPIRIRHRDQNRTTAQQDDI